MVKAIKGTLLECDPAIKQLLVLINEEEFTFIIEDLDECHLLIDPSSVDRLKERFEGRLEENVFKLSDGVEVKSTW
ncbi:hypothetical protein MIR68_007382 [Amoeboaphelidium protococcarum]|nr:hypothetical protein MIR68_007622 [Amoeboaphelidium protococcarum]KAI3634471.1 hypothetical protein MIR68_007382 [Amoeboaphelidium protococcarum]KAI3642637.1 hypothetical protein MP228_012192 [Amoeboaphelidium protococcarum]KAI3645516.1 hypothetical protein MP228_008444 [Amoeboaphelidium protococcarum]